MTETIGETRERTTRDFRAFGKLAESMLTMQLARGAGLFIEGKLRRDEWRDRQTQERRWREWILVTYWCFTDDKETT